MLKNAGGLLEKAGFAARPASGIPAWLDIPDPKPFRPKRKCRTVWISDIHLGTRGCNAAMLVDFLRSIECETLYLVGDIVDGWRLRKGWYWPDEHNEVIRRVLKMAHRGTRVVFMSGYTEDVILKRGVSGDLAFLAKPFTPPMLARSVREALDAPTRAAS